MPISHYLTSNNRMVQSAKRKQVSGVLPKDGGATSTRPKQFRSTYPRRRAVTACVACRERKKKCDNGRPTCGFCRSIGASCQYSDKGPSTFDPASLCILDRLASIETSLQSIGTALSTPVPLTVPFTRRECLSDEQTNLNVPANWTTPSFPPFYRVNTDSVLAWPIFQERLDHVPKYTFLDQRGEMVSSFLPLPVPGQPSHDSVASRETPSLSHLFIDWVDLQPFVDQYFRGANIKNPVLERSDVQALYEIIRERGPSRDCSTCLVMLVCALGILAPVWNYQKRDGSDLGPQSSSLRQTARKELRMADRFYQAARELLGGALVGQNLRSFQCLCLSGIYFMYRLDCVTALRMFHVAGNALQITLSTTGEMSTSLAGGETDAIQRLIWTCAKSERELLAEIPIGTVAISHFTHLSQYPRPPQTPLSGSIEDDWQSIEEDSWYYYLAEIALRRIADDIIDTLYPDKQQKSYHNASHPIENLIPIVREFEKQLNRWHQSLPEPVSFPQSPKELDSEVRYFSRSRYYLVSELLHRPFVCFAIHNSDATLNTEVLALANKGLCYARDYLLASNHGHRHHGKWLQLRRELTACCLLLVASESNIAMPEDWYTSVEKGHQNFEQWTVELPSLTSYTRILDVLSDSVRGHSTPAV